MDPVLRAAQAAAAGNLIGKLGIEFVQMGDGRFVARMPVAGNTQPYGLLHGGATAALCETVGSMGTAVLVGPERLPVGIELNINHIRSVTSGHVTASGEPLHVGRNVAVWDIRVHDDEGRLIAASRLTLSIRSQPASQPREDR